MKVRLVLLRRFYKDSLGMTRNRTKHRSQNDIRDDSGGFRGMRAISIMPDNTGLQSRRSPLASRVGRLASNLSRCGN